ncbi:pyridoxal phosphate-dependent aminotransferase [Belliella kenyensis]|uniref:Aminotransferase n=1 Tax=Belliella kenyensis TaxID=1472724 RepID=A0ABV8EHQ5_9BACT|nr:aminotransferase class I/II-fold pyridoxal phosphate-dependent enzyme [Belliella kenyensis]MCH7401724.1 aminotransferase class I/II-fold pyridoxal phosphate-dependent enzyme [Belliella kenyensis]MDN3604224.1 aminotransferase class I/II-fold pyridoxal phosphate-dependent enzyme [Belliella kenyensis]
MKGFSTRLAHIQEYYFSQKLKEVRELIQAGHEVINMGIGSPDLPPHPNVIAALTEVAVEPNAHGYQGYQGIPALRTGFARFYQKHYQVELDPDREILPLLGSKEGIVHVSLAFLDAGDEVLIPNPGYPTYASACQLVGAKAVPYDLRASNNWMPDFEALEKMDLSKVKLMWVNYPHMPTGARADVHVFAKLLDFGRRHEILIVHDNPYSFILEDDPKSIMSLDGAFEVAMELNSLSKTSNMAGWRIGVLVGKADYIGAVLKVKSNMDSGMFLGVQHGAIAALELSDTWYKDLNQIYLSRRRLIWHLAEKLHLEVDKHAVGMFVWAKMMDGSDDYALVDSLLKSHYLFVTPGSIFGSNGSGYIRFSLCVSEDLIQEAINRIK